MSGQATGWVLRHGPKDRAMRAVLVTIADAANRDGEHAYPGVEAMVEGSLYSRASVFRILRRLTEEGWIEVEEEPRGRGHATVYRLPRMAPERDPEADEKRVSPRDPSSTERVSKGSHPGPERVSNSEPALLLQQETTTLSPTTTARADVETVFAAWVEATGRSRVVLDAKRRRVIQTALATYPLDDVLDAVRGWQHSSHHRGENERATVYNDLTLILRDSDHIERFRDLERGVGPQPRAQPRTKVERGLRAIESVFLREGERSGRPRDGDRDGAPPVELPRPGAE